MNTDYLKTVDDLNGNGSRFLKLYVEMQEKALEKEPHAIVKYLNKVYLKLEAKINQVKDWHENTYLPKANGQWEGWLMEPPKFADKVGRAFDKVYGG